MTPCKLCLNHCNLLILAALSLTVIIISSLQDRGLSNILQFSDSVLHLSLANAPVSSLHLLHCLYLPLKISQLPFHYSFCLSVVSLLHDMVCPSRSLILNKHKNIFNFCLFPYPSCSLLVSPYDIFLSIPLFAILSHL